jgi:hypothetical protein
MKFSEFEIKFQMNVTFDSFVKSNVLACVKMCKCEI